MSSSHHETAAWQNLAASALACEEAVIRGNWTEFNQLCDSRTATLQSISAQSIEPTDRVVETILEADTRTRSRLEQRMKTAASELRKYARFRDLRKQISP